MPRVMEGGFGAFTRARQDDFMQQRIDSGDLAISTALNGLVDAVLNGTAEDWMTDREFAAVTGERMHPTAVHLCSQVSPEFAGRLAAIQSPAQ